jgi:hypothetical protein
MPDHDAAYPGSQAAKAKGCICPASDGIRMTTRPDCPLHGLSAPSRSFDEGQKSALPDEDGLFGAYQKGRPA